MARTLDPAAHAIRRDAFVESAQRLMTMKGYGQMSIQDVLDDLGASRGAFYHYFESKADLREAVLDRMVEGAMSAVLPLVEQPGASAVARLQALFNGIARWKGERTELLTGILEVWGADDNAPVRERYRQGIVQRLTPVLARIIEQGRAEGTFVTGFPIPVARVLASLILGANDTALELYYARRAGTVTFEEVEQQLAAYAHAFDRILGAPSGSWPITDTAILRQWFG
jgi:AcrR family transcriptional regulator